MANFLVIEGIPINSTNENISFIRRVEGNSRRVVEFLFQSDFVIFASKGKVEIVNRETCK